MTHGVTTNSINPLARLIGEVSTIQSLPLIPSDYALTISAAGTALPAEVQIASRPLTTVQTASPVSPAALFDTAVVQQSAASRLELQA